MAAPMYTLVLDDKLRKLSYATSLIMLHLPQGIVPLLFLIQELENLQVLNMNKANAFLWYKHIVITAVINEELSGFGCGYDELL